MPDEHLGGDIRSEVTGTRPHVSMSQLEPGAGKGIGEILGIPEETAGDFLVGRINLQREIRREHRWQVTFRLIKSIGNHIGGIFGHPLVGSGGAFGQLPVVVEEILEVVIAPLGGSLRPGDLEAAGDRVGSFATTEAADPSEALLLDRCGLGFRADMAGRAGSMSLTKGVSTGDKGNGFLVIHRHAGEGLADIARRGDRVRIAVGALGIHINESHLHGGERILEFTVSAVALVGEPLLLCAPVDLLRLPDILATTGEPKGLETHRVEGDIPGEDHQISPRDLTPILLLDWPEQAARLVEIAVVGPAVKWCETLAAIAPSTASVRSAVSTSAVPGHADEEGPIVTEIGGPPFLRIRHESLEVFLHCLEVEALELLRIIESLFHRIRER